MSDDAIARFAQSVREQESRGRANLYVVGNPDQTAKAGRLSRETGIPLATVERNLPEVESRVSGQRAASMIDRYPAIGKWAANPYNANIGRDDTDSLAKVSDALILADVRGRGDQRSLLGKARDIAARGLLRSSRGIVGAGIAALEQEEAINPFAVIDRMLFGKRRDAGGIDLLRDYARNIEGGIEARPQVTTGSDLGDAAVGGLESAPSSMAALVITALTRNPSAALAELGTESFGNSYLRAREEDLGVGAATAYAIPQAGFEIVGERLPIVKYIEDLNVGSSFFKTLGKQVVAENIGEQFTGHFQDLTDWATFNEGKTFGDFLAERPEAGLKIALATTAATGLSTTSVEGARRGGARLADFLERQSQVKQARRESDLVNKIMQAAAESKVRQRDPEAFKRFIEQQAEGTPAENIYVPADVVRELYQSSPEDFSFFNAYADQMGDASVTGGDIVLPTAEVAAGLAGTKAWEAIKDDVRLSPGGLSAREAQSFDGAMADEMEAMNREIDASMQAERAAMEPRERLTESMRDKLMLAGYRPDVAQQYAEMVGNRYATRAARLGQELTGQEADALEVRQVLPEALAKVQAADGLDMLIASLKSGKSEASERIRFGPSLAEFIAKRGGIADVEGDLKAMGADQWHRGGKFRRKLVRPDGDNEFAPDAVAQAAWEAGYFPNSPDRTTVAELYEAIAEEVAGRPVYVPAGRDSETDITRAAADELRAILDQQGLDEKSSPKQIREAVARYQAEAEGRGFNQSFNEGPRGRIVFDTSGKSIVELFEKRDLSTFIHESGHLFLEELQADAAREDAPQQLKDDWKAVQDWFKANGHPVKKGQVPVEAHELWARGWERFAMEGRPPSSALRKAFDAFRSWLLSIYKVVDNLNAPISPEVRGVMQRLIATDEEIAEAALEQQIKALFTTAAEAGMTEAEFAAYQAAALESRDEAFDALLYRTMAPIRRLRTQQYREIETNIRAEQAQAIDAQPVFRALNLLAAGQKLSRQWLIDTYGEDALVMMPRRVPPIYAEKGVNADAIADAAGFASGDEMVRMLMGLRQRADDLRAAKDKRSVRQVLIDEATADVMAERYGDILNDGSIEEEARALIHNHKQGEIIASEVRSLARRAGKRPTPYSIARRWAAERIASSKVNEAISGTAMQRYQRAARNAAVKAEAAMLAGDIDEAYRQKQAQMLNNALIAEASKAKEAVDAAVSRLGKLAKKRTIKSVDQAYLDQIHALLEQVEFRNRSQRSLDRQEGFSEWAAAQRAAGHDVVVPDSFAESLGTTHWSRLPVESLLGLDETIKQMVHLGRLKQTLLDGKERRDREQVLAEIEAAGAGLRQLPPSALNDPDRNGWQALKSKLRGADAAMIKIEQLVDWLDGGNPNGIFNRLIFRPLADAQGREADMMRLYVEKMNAAVDAMPKKQLADWRRAVDTPELINNVEGHPERGRPWGFYKDQIVMLALNMGNEGNIQRLLDGHGWTRGQVDAVLDRLMTEDDWKFVQTTWDTINELWPGVEELEKRVNGFAPEKVDAVPIETRFGSFRGGYFPAVYDQRWSTQAARDAENNLLERGVVRANVRSGSSQERATAVQRPILLNMEVITRHLGEVILDITHREALTEVWRLVSEPRVQRVITNAMGEEYTKLLKPWLRHIANDQARNANSNSAVVNLFRKVNMNVTLVGLGYRFMSSVAQIAGMPNIIAQTGPVRALEGWTRYMANPLAAHREVTEKSAEMRDRFSTMDRDIVERAREMGKKRGVEAIQGPAWFTKYAFHGILIMDSILTTAGWIGAYRKATAEGMSEEEAIYYSDKVVRKSQGAGGAKDQAAITREHEAVKSFLRFFSYFSALYNQQRDFAHRLRRASDAKEVGDALHYGFWVIVAPPILDAIIRGNGPDDEEDWEAWAAKRLLFGNLASIPGVREVVGAIDSGFGYKVSPVQNIGEAVLKGWENIARALDDEREVSSKWVKQTLTLLGLVSGKPTGQIATTAQFGYDVAQGEQEPEGVMDWIEGAMKGEFEPAD